jgi:hypothetical protein
MKSLHPIYSASYKSRLLVSAIAIPCLFLLSSCASTEPDVKVVAVESSSSGDTPLEEQSATSEVSIADCAARDRFHYFKPTRINFQCNSWNSAYEIYVEKVTYTSWNSASAAGEGEVTERHCDLGCRPDSYFHNAVKIYLSNPVKDTKAKMIYSQLALITKSRSNGLFSKSNCLVFVIGIGKSLDSVAWSPAPTRKSSGVTPPPPPISTTPQIPGHVEPEICQASDYLS